MNVFHKRPLALILCIGVGGFAFSTYSSLFLKILLIVASVAIFCASFIKIFSCGKTILRLSAVTLLFSVIFSLAYFHVKFNIKDKYQEAVNVTATIEETEPISSYTTKIIFKTREINEKNKTYKFIAYVSSEEIAGLRSGDIINFKAEVEEFSNSSSKTYNYAKGIVGELSDITKIKLVGSHKIHIPTILSNIREHVSRHITFYTDSESGGFLSALLIGERDKLSPQTRLDFKRIGISHILALSGMHLAILSLGVGSILTFFGVRKKIRLSITSVFIICYMLLTGFSVSVVRAGVMILIYSALFLLSKSKDSFTSLCCATAIIVTLAPYSVYDISLWLSAFATLGIIVLYEYAGLRKAKAGIGKKLLKWLTLGILSSVFAISTTLLISALTFGGISMAGILSTLIFSLLAEVIMYLGCITIAISWLIPVGKLVIPISKLAMWLANTISSIDYVYVRLDGVIDYLSIISLTVLIFYFAVFKIKNKERFLTVIISVFVLCNLIPLLQNVIRDDDTVFDYYTSENSDDFLITSDGESCLISSAKYSKNKGYTLIDILDNAGITTLDNYFLTHYSWQIEDELYVLLGNTKTKRIIISAPQNEAEMSILNKIQIFLQGYNTELIVLGEHEKLNVGKYRITQLYSAPYGEETAMSAFSVSTYRETILYVSSGLLEGKTKSDMLNYISTADQVILGEHGKKYKTKIYLTEKNPKLTRLIINSSNVFLTQELMREYVENGCDVISHPLTVDLIFDGEN